MQSLAEFLFRAQRRGELRFMLIGGRSLEAHGYVRNTKDVDFLIATHDIPVMERLLKSILSLMRLNPAALDHEGLRVLCEKFGNAEIWAKLQLLLS